MHLPRGVVSKTGKLAKIELVEVVSISNQSGIIEEFGITESGNEIQCFLPVTLGDILNISFDIPSGEEQIVDILVDGIVREIILNSRTAKVHHGRVNKVCACERRATGLRGKLEHCDMVVQNRSSVKDISPSAPDFNYTKPSAVGTIEVRVLREIPHDTGSSKNAKMEQAVRGPTFDDSLAWWAFSRRVDSGIIAPKYEIGLPNGQKAIGTPRKRLSLGIQGYYLWASFKFLYRPAADIQTAAFNTFHHQNWKTKASGSSTSQRKMNNTAHTADEKSFSPPGEQPEVVDKIHGLVQNVDNIGYSTHPNKIKDEFRGSSVSDFSPVLGLKDLANKSQDRSDKSLVEVKANAERSQPKKRTPLPGWPPANRPMTEEALINYDVEATVRNPRDGTAGLGLSNRNDTQGSADIYGYRCESSYLSESTFSNSQQNYGHSLRSLADVTVAQVDDLQGQSKVSDPLHSNSTGEDETTFNSSYSRDPLETKVWLSSYLQSAVEDLKDAVHEPTKCQKIGAEHQQMVSDMPHGTSVSLFRAKAGHYMSQSPLVATDTDKFAETPRQVPTSQLIAQPQKRKFDDFDDFDSFDIGASSAPNSKSGSGYSVNFKEQTISPRVRREEHARRRHAKQEALLKAKDEAEYLRRQIHKFEAGQAETIAREQAELEEYDIEMARVELEKETLTARLQELNDM